VKEQWDFYLCNVNDKLASIFLDLSLRKVAPVLSKPWLLWIWVYLKSPRHDGLTSSDEGPRINEIEDRLMEELVAANNGALLAGKITTSGRKEFYYYAETKEGFNEQIAEAMSAFPDYTWDVGTQEDAVWEQYSNVLYPGPDDLQRMGNRGVLDNLRDKGDVLAAPRQVMHWAFFASEHSRALFNQEVQLGGFALDEQYSTDGEFPFVSVLTRSQPVTEESIDPTTVNLMRLAERFGGTYDGWETQVTTQ
jgi:uncharacterized protein (TIGR01619 family)